jgi:hypothetical protein
MHVGDADLVEANLANLRRAKYAVNALLVLLRADPRVLQAYMDWRVWLEPQDEVNSQPMFKANTVTLIADRARRLVLEDLNLPFSWLPRLLVHDWILEPFGGAEVVPTEPDDWLPGKDKGGAAIIARYVDWFYRAEIRRPPESKRLIAREYLATLDGDRASDGRATIQAGIANAKKLLSGFEEETPPLPK